MQKRQQSYTQNDICDIIVQNLIAWKNVSADQIELTKLAGLTNVTYKAEVVEPQFAKTLSPAIVIFRQFGEAEGFVDKDIEKFVFQEIGKLDLGPKEYASGQNWRIEEYVMNGVHPDSHEQRDPSFQFNLMQVVQKFHCADIPLPNMTSSAIVDKMFSEELRLHVLNKISLEHLFEEEEINILQDIRDIVESEEEQNLLKSFGEAHPDDKLVFSHNDLNQLNIFLTPEGPKDIILIDFEYCSYNYATYDIANHLNESSINYKHAEEPFYKLVEENISTATQLHYIVLCYTLSQILEGGDIQLVKALIKSYPQVNQDKQQLQAFQSQVEDILRKHFKSEMPIKELRSKIKFLKSRVRRFMILSNYNWILWCVLQSKNPDVEFGHIKYAEMRLNLYTDQLKNEIRKMQKKSKSSDEDDQRTTSSDSDQQD